MICDEPGGPEPNIEEYRADELAGRAPAACLDQAGRALGARSHRRRLHAVAPGASKADAAGLQKAFGALGAPLSVLDLDSEAPRRVYGFDYLLVRPDLHVVWRGNALPKDPDKVARVVTGH